MSFTTWLRNLRSALAPGSVERKHRRQRSLRAATHRPRLEVLEDRSVPSTFTVLNLLDSGPDSLRAAVVAANANPGPDAINFATTGTIALTSGQLDITDSLTIDGPGAKSLTVSGNQVSRVFGLAGNPTVVIADLTVANGWTTGSPGAGISMAGGSLTLDRVTLSGNYAWGAYGGVQGAGGGLYVAGGMVYVNQSTFSGNSAVGSAGYGGMYVNYGGHGGSGEGGGLYVAGGMVHVNQSTLSGNSALGGRGGDADHEYWAQRGENAYDGAGGNGVGGGIRVAGGRAEFYQTSISGNAAAGGLGGGFSGWDAEGVGGGLNISPAVPPLVDLDTFTESNTINNFADIDPNIAGPYSLNGTFVRTLAISDVSILEGHSGTTAFVFTVNLSYPIGQAVSVNYATADGSATSASDYTAASGTLTIPAGQTTGTITVLVNGDRVGEPNETFVVNLSNPTNATIADGQGVGAIVDDEPRISISDVTRNEGRKNKTTLFTFTVTLSAAYDQAVTISYRTVNGTATTSDGDYIAKSGTLTFNSGETTKTITIEVKGDNRREANETFYLDLFGNSSNSLFSRSRGIGTILNDD